MVFRRWIDYDIDGDWDLLLSVSDKSSNSITKLYENIDGNLTENTEVILPTNIDNYSWAYYDNDGDYDILVSIKFDVSSYNTKLYKNAGNGFTEDTDYAIPGVTGNAQWRDYDNNGDLDILLSSKIYTNTGTGFVEEIDLTLEETANNLWIDYESDGDLDILINGYQSDSFAPGS